MIHFQRSKTNNHFNQGSTMTTPTHSSKPRRKKLPVAAARKQAMLGRPTKYRLEFVEEMDRYFDVEPVERVETKSGDIRHVFRAYPTMAGFAWSIGVARDTVHRWATELADDGKTLLHPEFSDGSMRARPSSRHDDHRSIERGIQSERCGTRIEEHCRVERQDRSRQQRQPEGPDRRGTGRNLCQGEEGVGCPECDPADQGQAVMNLQFDDGRAFGDVGGVKTDGDA